MADMKLDYCGLKCPLPVLKARHALKTLAKNAVLEITADDPASPLDFAHFCDEAGHQLRVDQTDKPPFVFTIIKG